MTHDDDPRIQRRDALLAAVRSEYETLLAAQKAVQEGAFHEDNKPEGDKDMRATEASYLARGQAQRVEQLAGEVRKIAAWEPKEPHDVSSVGMFCLVTLEDEDETTRDVLMAPGGAGTKLQLHGRDVNVITVTSPTGRALIRAAQDDDIEVRVGDGVREFVVVEIS